MAVTWRRIEVVKRSFMEFAANLEALAMDCYDTPYLEVLAPLLLKLRWRLAWFEAILMGTLSWLEGLMAEGPKEGEP